MKALLALPVLVAAVAGGSWGFLRASLPQLDGEARLDGLGAPVTVARDSLGVVQITAGNYGGKLGPHHIRLHDVLTRM